METTSYGFYERAARGYSEVDIVTARSIDNKTIGYIEGQRIETSVLEQILIKFMDAVRKNASWKKIEELGPLLNSVPENIRSNYPTVITMYNKSVSIAYMEPSRRGELKEIYVVVEKECTGMINNSIVFLTVYKKDIVSIEEIASHGDYVLYRIESRKANI